MIHEEIHWSQQAGFPLLMALQLWPLILAGTIAVMKRSGPLFAVGVAGALGELALAVHLWLRFNPHQAAFQFAERHPLAGVLQYHMGVDGVSTLFILLTAFLTLITALYSRAAYSREAAGRSLILIFLVEASLMSQFATLDLLWFTIASAAQLALVGRLLWGWTASPGKDIALTRYLSFMAVSVALLLAGAFLLGWSHAQAFGEWSFGLAELARLSIPLEQQSLIFFLLFYALAIRVPLFPLHGWLPVSAEHGALVVAPVFLLGLKSGIYGMLRFVFPLVPEAVTRWHGYVVGFAVVGVFYAAALALMQVNLRRLLAFAVISHTGILTVGLFSLGHAAFQGGVLLAANFGLAITGMLAASGFVFHRTRTMLLNQLGGLFDHFPVIGIAFLIAAFSTIGMPGTPGFDAVHLVLEATNQRFGALVAIFTALGNVAAAGFLLWSFQRAFLTGRLPDAPPEEPMRPVSLLERFIAVSIIVVLLATGFHSAPWLALTETSLAQLGAIYHPGIH